uniref:26S proteasome non-ATPase regulatory subunit 1 n=1 Tax=Meloidogyne javanica TaxID=6303 RepID=A0A915N686_MELJA
MAQVMHIWRNNPKNATPYLESLGDPQRQTSEKQIIIDNLDDWKVITATWFEMAQYLSVLETLANDQNFAGRGKAALLCSKVAYCLENYEKALAFALDSDNNFSSTPRQDDFKEHDSLYVNKIIEQALDTYKKKRNQKMEVEPKLAALIDRIFQQNLERRDFNSVIGLAFDTRRIDMVETAIKSNEAPDKTPVMIETLNKVWESQLDIEFRTLVLDLIFHMLDADLQIEKKGSQNLALKVLSICQCLIKLERPAQVAQIFNNLLSKKNTLVAYQLAFDLYENAPQEFLEQLKELLFKKEDSPENEETKPSPENNNLKSILSGEETIKHHMQFLIKNNHTDMLILKNIKDVVRGSCAHNATVIANGLMHTGTTCDDFLRENLDWISKATNWNKFNAVASLGLIHKGHEREARKILDPYLPRGDVDPYGFKEGGSLYAYATTSAVRHGGCLGLGLAALGTRSVKIYEHLRECLYSQNEAVSGEGAGIAMGLVLAGSMNQSAFDEMRSYILDTQHDKIQRGLRTGIAMLAYGMLEKAEPWIEILESFHSESIMRQTAVCMIAMAYAGSGNAEVVKRLLEKVAADPSSDVKRFATIAIGFVLSGNPELCLSHTGMLFEHFNGHIRYGAAIALGIACAGSGYKESVSRLEPLLQAKENFVRQGALIALSFVLIQHTESTCSNVVEFRKTITKTITEKSEDTITKFGAIVAQGILDAGGRNVTLSLHNRDGQPDMPSVLGTFVFLQHWYWHSLTHFISLAFQPTCLIGLNKGLKMPKIVFRCNTKASYFAYPPPLEDKKKVEVEKVEVAVLSTTNKKKGGEKKKEQEPEKMEVDEPTDETHSDDKEKSDERVNKEAVQEPSFHNISNPARVVRLQLRKLSMPTEGSQYTPIKSITRGGIIMFERLNEDEEEELVEAAIAGGISSDSGDSKDGMKTVAPHEPFNFSLLNY